MDIRMLIGGETVGAAGGAVFERKNPFTGEVASRAPSGSVAARRGPPSPLPIDANCG